MVTDQANTSDEAPKAVMQSPLVDLTGLTLSDVAELSDTVLGTALHAIMDAARNPDVFFAVGYQEGLVRN